ncbi:DUF3943 domain-containing protein [Piscinibacter sp.]|jgi:hypothetical protein|uniref:DUF3943 domain-containing protein n=1 Tax=Piscinibacter sp. TaxID=1903157 RepID=UPI002F409C56
MHSKPAPAASRAGSGRALLLGMALALGVTARAAPSDEPDAGEAPPSRSDSLPALEIIGFDILLNRFNKLTSGSREYDVNLSTIRRNLRSGWVVDNDPFKVNQFLHPIQGSMYHGFARSTGHDFWQSFGYTFAGSALWEIAGENTPPAKNDQVASGIAGSLLGEPLYRMANLVLETSPMPRFWRELTAAAISPSSGFNRLVYGERFGPVFASHNPAHYTRFQIGPSSLTQNRSGTSTKVKRNELLADFSIDYGLPGQPGYVYRRPFDYFTFQATGSSASVFENIMSRGLLYGRDYELGPDYRGVWGLYASYDYLAPQVFRVSSTALSLGTTGQRWLSDSMAVQGTALAGVGYAGVGTLHGANETDYHYGVTPQALLALRWIFGNRASADVAAREYFVSGVANPRGGHDNIVRAEAGLTLRIHKQHGIAIKYLWTRREARYPDLGNRTQTHGTLGLYYALIGRELFSTVEWRQRSEP